MAKRKTWQEIEEEVDRGSMAEKTKLSIDTSNKTAQRYFPQLKQMSDLLPQNKTGQALFDFQVKDLDDILAEQERQREANRLRELNEQEKEPIVTESAVSNQTSTPRNDTTQFQQLNEARIGIPNMAGSMQRVLDENMLENVWGAQIEAANQKAEQQEVKEQKPNANDILPEGFGFYEKPGDKNAFLREDYEQIDDNTVKIGKELIGKDRTLGGVRGWLTEPVPDRGYYAEKGETVPLGGCIWDLASDEMSEAEKRQFYALLGSGDVEGAQKYLKDYIHFARSADALQRYRDLLKLSDDAGLTEQILTRGEGALTYLIAQPMKITYWADVLGQNIKNAVTGENEETTKYSFGNDMMRLSESGEDAFTQDMGEVGTFLSKTGLSVANSVVNKLLDSVLPGLGGILTVAEAGAQNAYDAGQNGGDAGQQLDMAILGAGTEYASGLIPLEGISELAKSSAANEGLKSVVKSTLAQIGVEATQETATEVMDIIIDLGVMKDQSEAARYYKNYLEQNPDKGEIMALAATVLNQMGRVLGAGIGGAISGGMSKAIDLARGQHQTTQQVEDSTSNTPNIKQGTEDTASFGNNSLTEGTDAGTKNNQGLNGAESGELQTSADSVNNENTAPPADLPQTKYVPEIIGDEDVLTPDIAKKFNDALELERQMRDPENSLEFLNGQTTLESLLNESRADNPGAESETSVNNLAQTYENLDILDPDISKKFNDAIELERQMRDPKNSLEFLNDQTILESLLNENGSKESSGANPGNGAGVKRNTIDLLSPQSYAENILLGTIPQAGRLDTTKNSDPLELYFKGFDEGRTGEPFAEAAGQSGAQAQGAALDAAGIRQDADANATLSGQRAGDLEEGGESGFAKSEDDFGKLGKIVDNPNITPDWTITSVHGTERMAERGVTQGMVNNWISEGKVLKQISGNYIFISKEGAAVFTQSGKMITAYSSEYFDENMWNIIKRLFGE